MLLLVNDNLAGFNIELAMPLLSQQRREKVAILRNDSAQRESVAAYVLLREALSEKFGITDAPIFEYGDYGKPFLQGRRDIHFSMSHCREAVVCAVSNCPLGVDVESLRPYNERLARYTMNNEEVMRIESSSSPDIEFIRLWTMKEAIAKLSGRGIKDIKNLLADFSGNVKCVEVLEKGYIYSVAYE